MKRLSCLTLLMLTVSSCTPGPQALQEVDRNQELSLPAHADKGPAVTQTFEAWVEWAEVVALGVIQEVGDVENTRIGKSQRLGIEVRSVIKGSDLISVGGTIDVITFDTFGSGAWLGSESKESQLLVVAHRQTMSFSDGSSRTLLILTPEASYRVLEFRDKEIAVRLFSRTASRYGYGGEHKDLIDRLESGESIRRVDAIPLVSLLTRAQEPSQDPQDQLGYEDSISLNLLGRQQSINNDWTDDDDQQAEDP